MHTPRFSGQPINAGDLVLLRIPSLPRRISCANVGTVVPRFLRQLSQIIMRGHRVMRADTFCGLLRCAQTNTQEHTIMLKGLLRIRRDQQETPHALQEAELSSWYRIGEAYSAFRGWRPIPAALQSHSVDLVPGPKNSLPTSHPPTSERPYSKEQNTPDKTQSIKKLRPAVKRVSNLVGGKTCGN